MVRGHNVILDADLAELYDVTTREVVQPILEARGLKVVFVDLAHAGQGYRVLSFLGLGLLLLGTSVLYGKLSPRLLGRAPQ